MNEGTQEAAHSVRTRRSTLPKRLALAIASMTLVVSVGGGLITGLVMNDQVLGIKQDLPRYVAEETRSALGLEPMPFSWTERMLRRFLELRLVAETQAGVETRVIETAFGPIVSAYVGTTLLLVAVTGLAGWRLGLRWAGVALDAPAGDGPAEAPGTSVLDGLDERTEDTMSEYRPVAYERFRENFEEVAAALDALGAAVEAAGPLDEPTQRLVKLGIAIGAQAKGPVRSNVRRALAAGIPEDSIRHVAVLATPTTGYSSSIAALALIDEVLNAP